MSARKRNGKLHFTIGSATGHGAVGVLDLGEDLALVKVTLLYADRIKLCSVGASVLSGIAELPGVFIRSVRGSPVRV